MIEINAVFRRKETDIEAKSCVVDKVISLSGSEFDRFSKNLTRDWDFLSDNKIDKQIDEQGRYRCLLVTGEGRRDGILVDADGGSYARNSAFIPNADVLLSAGQYPALAEFNKKLADIVDYIAGLDVSSDYTLETDYESPQIRYEVDLEGLETKFGIDLMNNNAVLDMVLDMLESKPEIKGYDVDYNELIVNRDLDANMLTAESLADPSVTPADMYAYGYAWDGMIPLGKERALELFDQGHEVFRLYENNAEGVADDHDSITSFTGLFGIENPEWKAPEQEPPFQAFIMNREKYDKGETAGEWLTLPADADSLQELLERIGVEKPSEGAYSVTAVRMPIEDYIGNFVSKYDSLDELNVLASRYYEGREDFETEKLKAILTSGPVYIGRGTAALINLLDESNFDSFHLIDSKDAEALGRYYVTEFYEKPEGMSFEEFGRLRAKSENGVFTEQGFLYTRLKELSPKYTGSVPDVYKISDKALSGLRSKNQERLHDSPGSGKPSVMDEIKASRQTTAKPKAAGKRTPKKDKGETDL